MAKKIFITVQKEREIQKHFLEIFKILAGEVEELIQRGELTRDDEARALHEFVIGAVIEMLIAYKKLLDKALERSKGEAHAS